MSGAFLLAWEGKNVEVLREGKGIVGRINRAEGGEAGMQWKRREGQTE